MRKWYPTKPIRSKLRRRAGISISCSCLWLKGTSWSRRSTTNTASRVWRYGARRTSCAEEGFRTYCATCTNRRYIVHACRTAGVKWCFASVATNGTIRAAWSTRRSARSRNLCAVSVAASTSWSGRWWSKWEWAVLRVTNCGQTFPLKWVLWILPGCFVRSTAELQVGLHSKCWSSWPNTL